MNPQAVGVTRGGRPPCDAMGPCPALAQGQCRSWPPLRAHTWVRPYGVGTSCAALAETYVTPGCCVVFRDRRSTLFNAVGALPRDAVVLIHEVFFGTALGRHGAFFVRKRLRIRMRCAKYFTPFNNSIPRVRPPCVAWRTMQAIATLTKRQWCALVSMWATTMGCPSRVVKPCTPIAETYVTP
jgi:hypothetical protein